ncbi:hypothetical protein GCM10022240_01100 [Microbacterium kribbense]|uniref:Potassium transporter Trk n=1 Tax=Microbacterium kribbense TaxID=433645 RepID=A0ABP7G541_9MICO
MVDERDTPEQVDAAAAPTQRVRERVEAGTVRRAPKISVFLVLGAAIGVIAALILTFAFGEVDASGAETSIIGVVSYTKAQVFGFLLLICIPAGVALGGVAVIILDATTRRHRRQVQVQRETVSAVD